MFEKKSIENFQRIVDDIDKQIYANSVSMIWSEKMVEKMAELSKLHGATTDILTQTTKAAGKQKDALHKQLLAKQGITIEEYNQFQKYNELAKLARDKITSYDKQIQK